MPYAAIMAVPKTAVDKDHLPLAWKYEVGFAG